MARSQISLRAASKSFGLHEPFTALDAIDLEVEQGDRVAIVGQSGSGKSTLLNLIGGIDRPTQGEVWVEGVPLHALGESALSRFRGQHVGIVFQFFQLLPTLSSLENVLIAMDFVGCIPPSQRRERALELLEQMGVADQAAKLPAELSGGQQQRVAIARALANDPALILADEPTGNLDSETTRQVLDTLRSLSDAGKTIVLVTHEREFGVEWDRTITLSDGKVLSDERRDRQQRPAGGATLRVSA